MNTQKIYRRLTVEQKRRGVVFSSQLCNNVQDPIQNTVHEVVNHDQEPKKNASEFYLSGYKLIQHAYSEQKIEELRNRKTNYQFNILRS